MRSSSGFKSGAALALVAVLLAWGAFEAQSQQRRRPSRRATNPVRSTAAQPVPAATPDYEPRVVSTAEEQAAQDEGRTTRGTRRNRPAPSPTPDETLKT